MKNFSTMVLAGLGGIGTGLLRVGEDILAGFDRIIAIDNVDRRENLARFDLPIEFYQGNVRDTEFLQEVLSKSQGDSVFMNVCSGVDTVRLRTEVSKWGMAYIDAGASAIDGQEFECFTELMPYTNTCCHNGKPHLLCQGVNPGMVEMVARMMMADFRQEGESEFDITIFEYDSLKAIGNDGRVAIGWSVDDFVDELMVLPTFEYVDGKAVVGRGRGTKRGRFSIDGEVVNCRVIGHEDVWNLGRLSGVRSVKFCYGLSDDVMDVVSGGDAVRARKELYVPGEAVELSGFDKIVVKVKGAYKNVEKCMAWVINHGDVWKNYGVNGVQFQTCKSLLCSLRLLFIIGSCGVKGTFTGSTVGFDKELMKEYLDLLDIRWVNVGGEFAEVL